MTTEKIKALVEKHHGEATKIRQAIHMNPELGFEEHETAKLIAQTLEKHGIKARTGVAKTGVVGLIEGARPGKTVLLRADMDALAMTEEADVPYKSRKPGVMHACGHDGHVAGLLLCAMALNEMKGEMRGNVKLMFQPAEEMKGGGALPMIEEGVLEYPKVDAAFGCHLWGDGIEGQVRVRSGPTMASPDEFHIKIIGKGGHGASPHKAVDPVPLAAQVIMAFQTLASRRVDPLEPVVVSICAIHGGTVHNIIPETVEMVGTLRTFDQELRERIPKEMESILAGIVNGQGGTYEFLNMPQYPALINDEKMTGLARRALVKVVGEENIQEMPEPSMGGEDFAYLCQRVPSSFFFVGIAKDEANPALHHNPKFAWDDSALKVSAGGLCQVALDFLAGEE